MGLCSQVFGLAKQLLERELLRKRPQIGVAVLVRDSKSRLLMIQRKGSHGSGMWSVPGGAVEAGETIAEAMQRELFEETGIRASPYVLSSSWGDVREPLGAWTFTEMGVEGGTWLTLYGVVDLADENVTVWPERGKIQEVRWVQGFGQWPGELFAPFKQAVEQGLNPFMAGMYRTSGGYCTGDRF